MARQRKGLRAILRKMAEGSDRSTLFWWMVKNHADLSKKATRRLQWGDLCKDFEELGLTDITGKPASMGTARETWKRARRMVAEAEKRLAAQPAPTPGSVFPSRISKDWRPENAPAPEPLPSPAPAAGTAPGPLHQLMPIRKTLPHEKEPYDPEKQLARLQRVIDGRSGR